MAAGTAAALSGAVPARAAAAPARFAYVGCFTQDHNGQGKGLNVYRVRPDDGAWVHVQLVEGHPDPYAVTLNPAKGVLYAGHSKGDGVSVFAVDRATGRLSPRGYRKVDGVSTTHLKIDPTGRFLLTANYETANLTVLPIAPDGSLGEIRSQHLFKGSLGPKTRDQGSAEPHQVVFDPAGRRFYVPQKGEDRITQFSFDAETGAVTERSSVRARSGAGPRHMCFHPRLPIAYVINELNCTVGVYRQRPDGQLEPQQIIDALPVSFTGDSTCSTIQIVPGGRYLFAMNRGEGSVVRFDVAPDSGRLGRPRWFYSPKADGRVSAMSPDGRVLCVNTPEVLERYAIDPRSGDLVHRQTVAAPQAIGVGFLGWPEGAAARG